MSKNSDHSKGYHDARTGKSDRSLDTVSRILDVIIPGPSADTSENYKKGYSEGKKDRRHS